MKKTLFLLSVAIVALTGCSSEPVRVACLGDSITYGHGIVNRYRDAYPGILDSLLGDGFDVRNYGVCGATAMNKTDMPYTKEQLYKEALEFNPQIVTIMLGTNDSKPYNWKYKEDFKSDLKGMISELRALPASPEIWLFLPVPAMGHAWNINDSVIYNGVIPYIKEVAAEENIRLVDLNTPFQGKRQYFPDTIHPNEEGESMIADIVLKTIPFRKRR